MVRSPSSWIGLRSSPNFFISAPVGRARIARNPRGVTACCLDRGPRASTLGPNERERTDTAEHYIPSRFVSLDSPLSSVSPSHRCERGWYACIRSWRTFCRPFAQHQRDILACAVSLPAGIHGRGEHESAVSAQCRTTNTSSVGRRHRCGNTVAFASTYVTSAICMS